MSSAKRKSEKPNSELTVMQIFSKALTGGSEWYDKVNAAMIMHDRRMVNHESAPYSRKPFIPFVVNTNSACQVELTERKSSHTGVESTQRPSKAPREVSSPEAHLARMVFRVIVRVRVRVRPFLRSRKVRF